MGKMITVQTIEEAFAAIGYVARRSEVHRGQWAVFHFDGHHVATVTSAQGWAWIANVCRQVAA